MLSLLSTNSRPGTPVAEHGRRLQPDEIAARSSSPYPMSMPMNEPDSSVPIPDTVPPEMRGRTTQKRVSSTSMLDASLDSSAVAMTVL